MDLDVLLIANNPAGTLAIDVLEGLAVFFCRIYNWLSILTRFFNKQTDSFWYLLIQYCKYN